MINDPWDRSPGSIHPLRSVRRPSAPISFTFSRSVIEGFGDSNSQPAISSRPSRSEDALFSSPTHSVANPEWMGLGFDSVTEFPKTFGIGCRGWGQNAVLEMPGKRPQRDRIDKPEQTSGSSSAPVRSRSVALILHSIEILADRIEGAYRRRLTGDRPVIEAWVWTAAAVQLLRLHRSDPIMPLDPELYVAAQVVKRGTSDPKALLARPGSIRRYRRRVHRIIQQLRGELRAEARRYDVLIRLGRSPEAVLLSKGKRALSPLGSYIIARRIGRHDLAERLRSSAAIQHHACPLYRQACLDLLPVETYPVSPGDRLGKSGLRIGWSPSTVPQFSLN